MYLYHCQRDNSGSWYEIDGQDTVVSEQAVDSLIDCPKIDADSRLVILLPGEFVRMVALALPKMRAAEYRRAIPFMLEEDLATEPNDIDIIVGDKPSKELTDVAIFDKAAFQSRLALFHEQNLYPDVILPDYLALTWEEGTWTVCATEKMTLVRTGKQMGFSVDANSLGILLPLKLAQAVEKEIAPEKIICYQDGGLIDSPALEAAGIPIVFTDAPESGVFDFQSLIKAPALNMLQGVYRPKNRISAQKRNWWIACGAVVLWLMILFGGNAAQWIYFSRANKQLSAQVLSAYKQIFPGSQSVLEPRFRVQEILKKLKVAEKGSAFLRVLSAAGAALDRYPTITLREVQYQDEKLVFEVASSERATLSDAIAALRRAGLTVNQSIGKADEKSINATLTIQEVS